MKILYAVIAVVLASCASANNDDIISRAGERPPVDFSEKYVRSLLVASLKDPDSLKQFSIDEPRIRLIHRGSLNGGGQHEAWLICFTYNAKNSYGAYAGATRSGVFLQQIGSGWYEIPGLGGLAISYCK